MDRDRVRQQMEAKDSDQLLSIYREFDTDKYVPDVFNIIGEILIARGATVPQAAAQVDGKGSTASASWSRREIEPDAGFLSFRKMVSFELIRLLYLLGVLGLTGFGVMVIVGGQLALGLLVIVLGNLVWRLICEGGIVLFGIHGTLVSIDRKMG